LASSRIRVEAPPLDAYFNSLFATLGPQHWWPGKTQFEVIVGAILTQNASWTSVARAIANLRDARLLSLSAIERAPVRRIERLIRPSGYFRQKTRKLKAICSFLREEYQGSLNRMFETDTATLREKLLGVFGIGPETADSILLYTGGHPVSVVDAYTRRILARHGWIGENATYEEIRTLFMGHADGDTKWFNEFHALIVATGKTWCRPRQRHCDACPLGDFLRNGR
jgi:endonuclease-3 related protein